ncbi:MAG: prolyl-tRNA synthetase associated domain-containing protein [Hyphomicrobiaceae bacterium]
MDSHVSPLDDEATAEASRARLDAALAALGIAVRTVEHEAVFTVAESSRIEREIPGGHTKNLFLKDQRGAMFLVVAEAHTNVDLKSLARRLGAGRFSFGKADLLAEVLGVTPGSVTAFAVMNDRTGKVTVVIDRRLMEHETINCHPMANTATTNIARDDLLRFIRATGHEPRIESLESDPGM